MKPTGWYLGLRYMQGTGLVARVAEKLGAEHHGAQFIFADRVLLNISMQPDSGIPLPLREGRTALPFGEG